CLMRPVTSDRLSPAVTRTSSRLKTIRWTTSLKSSDVVQRIVFYRDDVRVTAGLNRSDVTGRIKQRRRRNCRRLNRLHRSHPVTHHKAELFRFVLRPRKAAGISPKRDLHALLHRL